jgi:protease-4
MSLETDLLMDRRRLKRRLNAWRVAAVLAVAVALLVSAGSRFTPIVGPHIARLSVSGIRACTTPSSAWLWSSQW